MLIIDVKLISNFFSKRIKKHLPSLISSNETCCVDKRFISEGSQLISEILEIKDLLMIRCLMLTVDIRKLFCSVNYRFLINVLKMFGFEKNLVTWIKILLKIQESCISNGAITTKYFKLEGCTRQGDQISAYLFILVLEVVFAVIKSNQNNDKLRIFEHEFLYRAYADDTLFFVRNQKSVIKILKIFDNFSKTSRLKPNKSK